MGTKLKRAAVVALTPIFLAACYGGPPVMEGVDNDWDDWTDTEGDCDDSDASVNPDADEICDDEVDNNCDGVVDEEDCVEDEPADSE